MGYGDYVLVAGLVGGFVCQAFILLAGLSFAWGQVKSQIIALTSSIDRLTDSVGTLDGKIGQHGERIARLEAGRS